MGEPAPIYAIETGEVLECAGCQERDEVIVGLKETNDAQVRRLGNLKRRLERETDVTNHPQYAEIFALVDYWKKATGHPNAKTGETRIKLVKARLKDGYTFNDLALAIDGLAAYPYKHFNERRPTGEGDRDDDFSVAMKDEKAVERFANLGARARRA